MDLSRILVNTVTSRCGYKRDNREAVPLWPKWTLYKQGASSGTLACPIPKRKGLRLASGRAPHRL